MINIYTTRKIKEFPITEKNDREKKGKNEAGKTNNTEN